MRFKKEEIVTARLHASTKKKLSSSGYNAAEAIEWFVHEYYNNNPKRKVAIQRDMLEIKLNNLKEMECEVQSEISVVERQLDELGDLPLPEEKIDPIPEVNVLPDNLQEAVDRIKRVFDDKKDMIVGNNTTPVDALDVFIALNGDFVRNVYSEFGKGLKWKDFRELLLEEVVS